MRRDLHHWETQKAPHGRAVRTRASIRYVMLDLRILDMHLGFREGLMQSLAKNEVALEDLMSMYEFPVY